MTQAYNLSQLANNVNSAGKLNAAQGLGNTVPVLNGGTGQSSFADGELLIGNSTSNTLTKATLTQGTGITITNGNGSITIAATGGSTGSIGDYALFTSGSGTWTCPSGITKVKVTCIAGGGGSSSVNEGDARGGYAGAAIGIYTVTPGAGYAYSVGAGGAHGYPYGGNGGSSSVAGLCSATGGSGAVTNTAGADGTGSNGIFFNDVVCAVVSPSFVRGGSLYMFGGGFNTSSDLSAVTWSPGSKLMPGSPGGLLGLSNGGVGGVILIEYLG